MKGTSRREFLFLAPTALMLSGCAASFGDNPDASELERFSASPNFRDGKFINQIDTPMFAEDKNFLSVFFSNIFQKSENTRPERDLPAARALLSATDPARDAIIWLGHSSYCMNIGGLRIVLDPVLQGYAAPFSGFNKAFPGTTLYNAADLPDPDLVLISHDHWDHLEYETIIALKDRARLFVCPLGVGSHLRDWGVSGSKIMERDWHDSVEAGNNVRVVLVPARHFSGRGLVRDKTLWCGFVLHSPAQNIYISGDSGYGPHFAAAGKKYGPFDLAIIEDGQYDARWPFIHMQPEEGVRACLELGCRHALPCHNGRFAMASHTWDAPPRDFASAAEGKLHVIQPRIGDIVWLDNMDNETFPRWWD